MAACTCTKKARINKRKSMARKKKNMTSGIVDLLIMSGTALGGYIVAKAAGSLAPPTTSPYITSAGKTALGVGAATVIGGKTGMLLGLGAAMSAGQDLVEPIVMPWLDKILPAPKTTFILNGYTQEQEAQGSAEYL